MNSTATSPEPLSDVYELLLQGALRTAIIAHCRRAYGIERDGAERLIAAAEERLAARACVSRRRELARVRRRLEALLATCTARKDEGAAAAAERLLQSLASE